MADRAYDRNAGFVSLPDIPDDQYIAGVVVVLMDENGEYTAVFKPESLDATPIPEVQEALGPLITQAWAMANTPGVEAL